MTELLSISNIGTKGLNSDVSPWDLPPEYLTNANNFKVTTNAVYSSGGYADWSTSPTSFNAGFILSAGNSSQNYWIVAGRTHVISFDGFTWVDITSAAGYSGLGVNDELLWTGCVLGGIPIVNNPQAHPEYWSPASPGQILQPLPWDAGQTWADVGMSCRVIRAHKTFLFALNISEVTEQPDTYRWSTSADINGLPYTWDETDTSGLAGVASLGGDGGGILDGLTLRDSFILYSRNAIDVLDFTGDEFIWRRRELSNTIGIINTNCVVEANGFHYFISPNDILRTDGTSIESIINKRIKQKFLSSIDYTRYRQCFVMSNTNKNEVWFCIPSGGTDYTSIAFVYNWQNDTWGVRDLPNCAYAAYGILYAGPSGLAGPGGDGQGGGTVPPTAARTWANWTGTWDVQTGSWNSNISTGTSSEVVDVGGTPTVVVTGSIETAFADSAICVINSSSSLKLLEPSTGITSGNRTTILERTDFPLDGLEQVTTITAVYPRVKGTGTINIQFGSQAYPGASVLWKPAIAFTPGVDRKLNLRSTGALHAWRITSEGQYSWTLSGLDIAYEKAGKR